MSGTDRNRICNPGFFSRGQGRSPAPRVRLVPTPPPAQGAPKPLPPFLQRGFTYLGLMLVVAVMGGGMAAFGELYSHAAQREKERELLFVGNQFRQAIASYYNKSPGIKAYPKALEELLEDKRFPMPQRHLRRLYADPVTGKAQWGLVEAPGGGIMGVHSLSEETPIKTANFAGRDEAFEGAAHYTKWTFTYSPPGLGSGVAQAPKR